jgi:electron transport complex protein RnfD
MMLDVVYAMIPALILSFYIFGLNALITTVIAVASCIALEYLIQKYLIKGEITLMDGSALVTGVLLAFNVPAGLPPWMVIVGSVVAIGVAKLTFGGVGNNIFNPALVGRVFLLVSFPVAMTTWPVAMEKRLAVFDTITGATPLGILKDGIREGATVNELSEQLPEYGTMLLGFTGGSLGEVSALALLLGGIYLLWRKVITWHIPVSVLGSMLLLTGIMWLIDPEHYVNPLFHLMSGGAMLGAFYMATDLTTSPMTRKGMIIFGCGIGFLTVIIRLYGAYPEGISFAILIMNAFVPILDRYIKPRRFGELKKVKL